jgi:uncharacterized integral membrane protein
MKLKLSIVLTLFILVLIFAVQNAAIVELKFLFWVVEFPRSLLLFITMLIGVAIGWFLKPMFRFGGDQ